MPRIVSQAFGILEKRMPAEGYAVGPQFSIADAALFYNEFWATRLASVAAACRCALQRVRARPVVRQVLARRVPILTDWPGDNRFPLRHAFDVAFATFGTHAAHCQRHFLLSETCRAGETFLKATRWHSLHLSHECRE